MNVIRYNLEDERVRYLVNSDEKLGRLITHIGTSEIVQENDGFQCLVKYIIGQQISDKARETIWLRICTLSGGVTPTSILSTDVTLLRNIGLSYRKIEYIRNLAEELVHGSIDFNNFRLLSNEEIVAILTSVKGIGRWTAEMYLIFSLGRENVLSQGDGTIKRSIQWMYDLTEIPSANEISYLFRKWTDYASIVSAYLWKAIALGLTRRPFDDIIPMQGV